MSEGDRGEVNMDKKTGRYASVVPKGNGTEYKKDNGINSSQKYPRPNRRKDVGTYTHDQAPTSKRPPAQKNRFVEKRPRARGLHNGNSRDEMTVVDGTDPEYGSVQSWGSKKSNLSHLLNFHFEPRDPYSVGGLAGRGSYHRNRGRSYRSKGTRYNKEHFLQANCQFIVKENGDYTVHTSDPDTLVNWDLIEQVRTYSHAVASCPICLYPPTAAKITRCGHVYCAPCILHYLSLGEKQWRRCPICYDAVLQKDLKSVVALETHTYSAGQEITMKLMKRRRGTTLALPVSQWSDNDGQLYNMDGAVDSRYVKLLAASQSQVQSMLDGERHALYRQLKDEGTDSLEGSYIQAALDLLQERQAHVTLTQVVAEDIEDKFDNLNLDRVQSHEPASPPLNTSQNKKTVVYTSAFSDDEDLQSSDPLAEKAVTILSQSESTSSTEGASTSPDTSTLVQHNQAIAMCSDVSMTTDESLFEESSVSEELVTSDEKSEKQRKTDYYYFFQAEDGQHIYTHSINTRCLIKEYGSLENCPHTITARIVELEDFTMHDELRQRLRYLSHLPVTCEFQVAELNIRPPLVSKETVQLFSGEIDRRKKQRQRKNREERKLSQRIQEREHKELGIDRRARIVYSDAPCHVVPSVTAGPNSDLMSGQDNVTSTPIGSPSDGSEFLATSPTSTGSSEDGGAITHLSFAQMLRAGKAKEPEVLPWAAGSPGQDKPRQRGSGSESENEDRVPVPTYQASFGDAIQEALDKYKQPGSDVVTEVASPGKKKKKKQKTLLFATTMNRTK